MLDSWYLVVVGWLSNSWVVGIVSGLMSSVIGTLVVRWFFTRKDRSEYARRVDLANKDVVYALRLGIPDNLAPKSDVVESLINATARRHGVKRKDIFDPVEVREELIKEIMDSSFISTKTKSEYCEQIGSLTPLVADGGESAGAPGSSRESRGVDADEFKTRGVLLLSVSFTTVMALTAVVSRLESGSLFDGALSPAVLPAALGIAALATSAFAFYLRDRVRRSEAVALMEKDDA